LHRREIMWFGTFVGLALFCAALIWAGAKVLNLADEEVRAQQHLHWRKYKTHQGFEWELQKGKKGEFPALARKIRTWRAFGWLLILIGLLGMGLLVRSIFIVK